MCAVFCAGVASLGRRGAAGAAAGAVETSTVKRPVSSRMRLSSGVVVAQL